MIVLYSKICQFLKGECRQNRKGKDSGPTQAHSYVMWALLYKLVYD